MKEGFAFCFEKYTDEFFNIIETADQTNYSLALRMNKQRIELKVEKLSFIAQNHEKAWEKGSLDLINIAIKRRKLR